MAEIKTDTAKKAGLFHAITQLAGRSYAGQMLAAELHREIHRAERLQRYEDYSKNIHENCTYCRKRCKLFKPNKCFNKSTKEQMECEHFDKDYVSVMR